MLNKFNEIKNEDGAIAAIFAILMSLLVVGLLALVVDVGALYAERRVVQNAADASVLATAQECATNGTGAIGTSGAYASSVCANQSYVQQFAGTYANLNSPDSLTDVSEVCGTSPLNSCSALTTGKYECKNVDSKYVNYVRVKTSTRQSTGTGIKSLFSSDSNGNSETTAVGCAQAAWGKPASAPVILPIAISVCDWQLSGDRVLFEFPHNDPVITSGCAFVDTKGKQFNFSSTLNGMSLLSGFGCPGVSVTPQPKLGDILYGETALPQVLCKDNGGESAFRIALANLNGAKIFLPLVGSVICSSQSSNCQGSYSYKVVGFVGIKYLGSKWTNQFSDGSTPTCPIGDPCQTNSNWPSACDATRICLYGTFERSVVPGADISLDAGTPDIGALAVQLLP